MSRVVLAVARQVILRWSGTPWCAYILEKFPELHQTRPMVYAFDELPLFRAAMDREFYDFERDTYLLSLSGQAYEPVRLTWKFLSKSLQVGIIVSC